MSDAGAGIGPAELTAPTEPAGPENTPASAPRRRRRRRTGRVVGAAVAVVAVAAGTATGLGFRPEFGGGEPSGDGGGGNRGLPPTTAPVTRQTLVDTETETGELGHGDQTAVSGRLTGTVTGLPAAGSAVERGKPLYHLDNTPVVLLYGALPAYRALAVDAEGADVRQLEENLWALGHRGFTIDDEYTSATATAVRKWQKSLGLEQTGALELGRVVYAAGPVRVDTLKAAVGDAVQPGGAVLTHTGLTRVVVVDLDVAQQRLATIGAPVTVKLPDGRTVDGKVARTLTVIDAGDDGDDGGGGGGDGSGDAKTKIRVTVDVEDQRSLDGLDQAAVSVVFTASRREGVLTVPVAALLALAEGGYGVQLVEGAATRIVAVETGMFANGRVEVSGSGIAEGAVVGMPT
ncbi:peptidoglycan-binding protein [Yinghuangia sp. YIM S09857]|uniref:peptidoglycan-binding protein n=1 Tax=Yinghuangia sp. YIM S09857 TaxID=3436929 RepID=UPI003F52FC86